MSGRRGLLQKIGEAVDNRFIFTIKTDNAGTSSNDQFTIPTTGTGYNYDVETSDGYTATGLTGNHTITFPSGAGTYDVYISGSFPYMFFNNGGDRQKMLDISNFGIYALGSTIQSYAFRGCSNMTITATDSGNFGNVTNFNSTWRDCSSLTSFPLIDTSSGIIFASTWIGCSSLTSFPLLDVSNGGNFSQAWRSCSSLTSFPLLDVSNGTNFSFSWFGCSNLTSFPSLSFTSFPPFNNCWQNCTSLANFPANMFDNTTSNNFLNNFTNTNLSQTSIDNILVSIESIGNSGGTFNQSGGFAPSSTGETAIDALRDRGWTVTVTGGY